MDQKSISKHPKSFVVYEIQKKLITFTYIPSFSNNYNLLKTFSQMEPSLQPKVSSNKTDSQDEGIQINNVYDNQFSVQAFLCPEALIKNEIIQEEYIERPSETFAPSEIYKQSETVDMAFKRGASVFHNFHKHTITLVKKHCRFTSKTFGNNLYEKLALALWQIFEKTRSTSKRTFNIIFGFSPSIHLDSNINLLAQEFKQFRKIKEKYNIQQILGTQQLLRNKVCQEMSSLSRQSMSKSCRINNFEYFFIYVTWFLEQLQQGEVNKRLIKRQIQALLQSPSLNSSLNS